MISIKWNLVSFLRILIIFILFQCIFSLLFPIVWNENDDYLMKTISDGFFSDKYRSNLIFINTIFGKGISYIESIFPSFEWYSIFFLILYSACNSTIGFIYIYQNKNKLDLIILLISIALWGIKINTQYQFTMLASYMALCGYLIFFTLVKEKINSYGFVLISSLFLIVSSLIRTESFVLITLFFIPFYILFFKKISISKISIYFFYSYLVIISFYLYNNISYRSDDWSSYTVYNSSRAIIVDSPSSNIGKIEKAIESENWHLFDLKLFRSHFYENSNVFSLDKIYKINSVYKSELLKWPKIDFVKKNIFYIFILIAIFIIYFTFSDKKTASTIFISFCFSIILLFILSTFRVIHDRVIFPIFFAEVICLVLFCTIDYSKIFKFANGFISVVLNIILTALIGLIIYRLRTLNNMFVKRINEQEVFVSQIKTGLRKFYKSNESLGVILGPIPFAHFANISVFNFKRNFGFGYIKPIYSGWLSLSPIKREYMRQFGNPDLPDYQMAINNPKIIFLYESNNSVLKDYLNHHYPKVEIDTFYFHPSGDFCAFRLKSSN